MATFSRRRVLPVLAAPWLPLRAGGHAIGLNTGTYGMKSLKTEDALRTIAEIGYDGVEIALMRGWPTDPEILSTGDRRQIRSVLQGTGLVLPSLMESLSMDSMPKNRARRIERLKLAMTLAHDLAPDNPPVIETVLGRKSAEWDQVKSSMGDELADWANLGTASGITICFKPHADQAVDMPDRALWLLEQVASAHLRIIYDYSHFIVQGLSLKESLRPLLPYTSYIAVKDAAGDRDKHQFLLPGDGHVDYLAYFRLLKESGYNGFVGIEITSQIHSKPGYEPVSTARLCYSRIASALEKAGVERPVRKRRA